MDELNFITEYNNTQKGIRPPNNIELMNKINEIVRWINSQDSTKE